MVEYMSKETIVETIERIGFENGLFVTDFDFSLPEKFEDFFEETKKFLDSFKVVLLIPMGRKFFEVYFIKSSTGNSQKGVSTTILPETYTYNDNKPVLFIYFYFNFLHGSPKNKKEVFDIVKKYQKELKNLYAVNSVRGNMWDYLEASFTIKDFSFDYFYSNLF
jgi:hypothetical protein